MRRALIPSLFLLAAAAMAVPAAAQESGGLGLSPEALAAGGPRGLARPLPYTFPNFTAADLQTMPSPAERRARHQGMIAKVRGDGGYLDGFAFGQPIAASRRKPPPPPEPVFMPVFVDQRTEVFNQFDAPVAVTMGNNNVVLQQGSNGSGGPSAQQQVVTVGGRSARGANGAVAGGGATNMVTADGNIIQSSSGRRRGGGRGGQPLP